MTRRFDLGVYLVTDQALCLGRPLEDVVRAAASGGATMVQLREKALATRPFVEMARALVAMLRPLGVPLLVNDRLDVALACGADGLHVGQDDLDPLTARELLGPEAILGLSVSTLEETVAARDMPVDYLGAGPVYPTATKADAKAVFGPRGLAEIVAATHLPVVAIGGCQASNAARAVEAGAMGVAVVSAICSAKDPALASREIALAVARGRLTSEKANAFPKT
ncbi:thiamine phosphate synthase [Fundidesulfovibrio butyratiphilus]